MRIPELRCNGEDPERLAMLRDFLDWHDLAYNEVVGDTKIDFPELIDEQGAGWHGSEAICEWAIQRSNTSLSGAA